MDQMRAYAIERGTDGTKVQHAQRYSELPYTERVVYEVAGMYQCLQSCAILPRCSAIEFD